VRWAEPDEVAIDDEVLKVRADDQGVLDRFAELRNVQPSLPELEDAPS